MTWLAPVTTAMQEGREIVRWNMPHSNLFLAWDMHGQRVINILEMNLKNMTAICPHPKVPYSMIRTRLLKDELSELPHIVVQLGRVLAPWGEYNRNNAYEIRS